MTTTASVLATLTFKNEDGYNIPTKYLNEMLEIAISKEDFVQKVTYGCTNETNHLDPQTVKSLNEFYDHSQYFTLTQKTHKL